MAIFVHCLSFCRCWLKFHLLSRESPELLSIQAAPACSVTQGHSISDIVLNLHAKREKTQDMKDNCHKWLNGVQGGKVIMKPILSIEYPHLAFLQQLLGSTVHYSLGAGAGWKRYHIIKSLIQYDIWFLQLQFKITTQLCHSLLLLYTLVMQDSSASLQFGSMWDTGKHSGTGPPLYIVGQEKYKREKPKHRREKPCWAEFTTCHWSN